MNGPCALLVLLALSQAVSADSLEARREARDEQARFERVRRNNLPYQRTGYGRCDVRAGNYCYWYDEAEPPAPPEPARTVAARRELLARLGELAGRFPGDGWIAAQRVRYWAEHGEADSALAAARACAAAVWWCAALEGYARHAAGGYADAEASFDRAQAAMPGELRCEWNDLEPLLEGEIHAAYKALDCAGRDSANRVVFWLGRPRFGVPGNDVRTAWFARHTLVRSLEGAITHHGSRLDPGHRELILRYGWATGWSRRPPPTGSFDDGSVIGHESKPAYPFLPDRAWAPGFAWRLDRERPRARFAPPWAPRVVAPARVATTRFERGDSLLLVAAFELDPDTLFRSGAARAVLALSAGPGQVSVSRAAVAEGRGSLIARAAGRRALVSLEITDSATGAVALERTFVESPSVAGTGIRLSELLLFTPGAELPGDPAQAARSAWAGGPLPAGGRIGLYWEIYGVPASTDSVQVTVSVDEAGPGLFTRLGRVFGLGRRPPPLRLGWRGEEGPGQAIELDLRLLQAGRYRIRVSAEVSGHAAVEADRVVELVRR